jgi:glutamate carboxypeptidase
MTTDMSTMSTPRPRHRAVAPALAAIPLLLVLAGARAGAQQGLSEPERRMRDDVARRTEEQIAFLQKVVDIPSGTLNVAGVRRVGDVFRQALDSLGFRTRWVDMPDGMGRAGHLVAEHRGKPGRTRLLLIGHLDTVFEGEGQQFVREDTIARGAGSGDMKGGDVIILYALKALASAGALKDANVTVVLTGDEESPGDPLDVARQALVEAAKRNDVALAFEGGSDTTATVGRRGASEWRLVVTGKQGHSAGVFGDSAGYGAIYELARILDAFRSQLAGEQYLTFNPGVVVGGTKVDFDTLRLVGTAAGKTNIIAPTAVASGDLRFLSEEQKERARARMREIVAASLPATSAEITFADGYPAMTPTPGNARLLAVYDSASRALGYPGVKALDPGRRGAGDVSFVAPYIDGLDGLGALGGGSHSPREHVDLPALTRQTQRAAVLIYRLSRQKPPARRVAAR